MTIGWVKGIIILLVMNFFSWGFLWSTDKSNLELIGTLEINESEVNTLAIRGNYAYLGCTKRLLVIDISDKTAAFVAGEFPTSNNVSPIAFHDRYAYIIGGLTIKTDEVIRTLYVLDISNPPSPVLEGTYDIGEYPTHSIYISGNKAYLGQGYIFLLGNIGKLIIFDIENPVSPVLESAIYTNDIEAMCVYKNYAYCVCTIVPTKPYGLVWGELSIFNVSSPKYPTEKTTLRLQGIPRKIVFSKGYALIVSESPTTRHNQIEIYDVSIPGSPKYVNSYSTTGTIENITISGKYTYIADGTDGIKVIDFSNPLEIQEVAKFKCNGKTKKIMGSYDYIYVINDVLGFMIFKKSTEFKETDSGELFKD